jgi:catechol 2,3-dioxygenase-like lactoylglutathione lyase family enzyme
MIGRWSVPLSAMLGLAAATSSAQPAKTPAVTGISHIAVYARDLAASDHFYGFILGGVKSADPEDRQGVRYYFGPQQFVEVLPAPPVQGPSMLAHVAYSTPDAAGLRRYFAGLGTATSELRTGVDGSRWFSARDPEGNALQFVQAGAFRSKLSRSAISGRIIHVGYLVHNREAEDRFYRSILGFRPYWFGAMKENAVDWVSQQVPNGRDWLEYMMVGPGSTVPADRVDARELGVLNHVSLGVPNMEAAVTRLYAEKRLSERHDGPSMGRDGKWQANLYDPDGTRVELMEYHAVAKPCCSSFTAADPTP